MLVLTKFNLKDAKQNHLQIGVIYIYKVKCAKKTCKTFHNMLVCFLYCNFIGSEEVRKASSEDILSVHPECLHITSQVLFLPWLSDESMEMMFLW